MLQGSFCGAVDGSTVCNGQRPGPVIPGVAITLDHWNPAGYFGPSSQEA
jgi:hypothetical protein